MCGCRNNLSILYTNGTLWLFVCVYEVGTTLTVLTNSSVNVLHLFCLSALCHIFDCSIQLHRCLDSDVWRELIVFPSKKLLGSDLVVFISKTMSEIMTNAKWKLTRPSVFFFQKYSKFVDRILSMIQTAEIHKHLCLFLSVGNRKTWWQNRLDGNNYFEISHIGVKF